MKALCSLKKSTLIHFTAQLHYRDNSDDRRDSNGSFLTKLFACMLYPSSMFEVLEATAKKKKKKRLNNILEDTSDWIK